MSTQSRTRTTTDALASSSCDSALSDSELEMVTGGTTNTTTVTTTTAVLKKFDDTQSGVTQNIK